MTEDEARTKWCPFINIGGNDGCKVTNRGKKLHDDQWHCIASDCMVFRWDYAQAGINYGAGELPTKGYCGLAGKP